MNKRMSSIRHDSAAIVKLNIRLGYSKQASGVRKYHKLRQFFATKDDNNNKDNFNEGNTRKAKTMVN